MDSDTHESRRRGEWVVVPCFFILSLLSVVVWPAPFFLTDRRTGWWWWWWEPVSCLLQHLMTHTMCRLKGKPLKKKKKEDAWKDYRMVKLVPKTEPQTPLPFIPFLFSLSSTIWWCTLFTASSSLYNHQILGLSIFPWAKRREPAKDIYLSSHSLTPGEEMR